MGFVKRRGLAFAADRASGITVASPWQRIAAKCPGHSIPLGAPIPPAASTSTTAGTTGPYLRGWDPRGPSGY